MLRKKLPLTREVYLQNRFEDPASALDPEVAATIPHLFRHPPQEKELKVHSPGVTSGPLPAKDITKKHAG